MSFVERFIIQCPYFGGSTIAEIPLYYIILLDREIATYYREMIYSEFLIVD